MTPSRTSRSGRWSAPCASWRTRPGRVCASSTSSTRRRSSPAPARPDGPEPAAAFLDLLATQQARIGEEVQEQLKRRTAELEQQFQDKKDLKWYADRAEGRAKREEARLRRLAAQDALDLLVSWVRDLWVVASGASDVLWNSDHRDALVDGVVATPEQYARLLGVAAKTRKDLYLNIDQKLALQAMFARFEEVSTSG